MISPSLSSVLLCFLFVVYPDAETENVSQQVELLYQEELFHAVALFWILFFHFIILLFQ